MTQDEIIEMAREASLCYQVGVFPDWIDAGPSKEEIIAFAKLVAAKEREACARVCDDRALDFMSLYTKFQYEQDNGAEIAATQCARYIRARGEQA